MTLSPLAMQVDVTTSSPVDTSMRPRRCVQEQPPAVDTQSYIACSGGMCDRRTRGRKSNADTRALLGLRYINAREHDTVSTVISRALLSSAEKTVLAELDTGKYLSLDRNPSLVRSTISIAFSSDGKFFASTHGDHTVKVFRYPEGAQVTFLEGHPRTPWTVRFHPTNPAIIATGCLGKEVIVWDHTRRECIRRHSFAGSISCVSFSPDGSQLAVTSGNNLMIWDWAAFAPNVKKASSYELEGRGIPGIPRVLATGRDSYHMVDFHRSGKMIVTGEKNGDKTHPDANPGSSEQFTLKVVVHHFQKSNGVEILQPLLVVPRVVAYNDAGIHFSPCGTMLAACIPGEQVENVFRIAVLNLAAKGPELPVGKVLHEIVLDAGRTIALTNLKFSPCSSHLLAGYSFRRRNPVLRYRAERAFDSILSDSGSGVPPCPLLRPRRSFGPIESLRPQVSVVDIYELSGSNLLLKRSLTADVETHLSSEGGAEDEINVAVFAPADVGCASGIIYGTQKGRVRMFQQYCGNDDGSRLGSFPVLPQEYESSRRTCNISPIALESSMITSDFEARRTAAARRNAFERFREAYVNAFNIPDVDSRRERYRELSHSFHERRLPVSDVDEVAAVERRRIERRNAEWRSGERGTSQHSVDEQVNNELPSDARMHDATGGGA